jgi:hypothetical protein
MYIKRHVEHWNNELSVTIRSICEDIVFSFQHNPRVLTKAASAVRHSVVILGIQKSVLKSVENVQVQVIKIL